ncbi:hypothetical protein [Methanobrevibacter sp.]|uniref:hypothetical protein n=1 Tax=Methanobrevibacter sp. TaxID=66852 RepID=UPI0025F95840|nr:hypothetical protein [Methanobrevibacter sp.]MBR4446990.1 hypothetical protein [Methanobrevibacter sp.]
MGNTIKLVSGFILFVIGVLLAYETVVYNLIDILLIVGLIISIVGIIMIVSYFVDLNADRTTNMLKEFLESKDADSPSFRGLERKSKDKNRPLKLRKEFNDDNNNDIEYEEFVVDDYPDSSTSEFFGTSFEDNPKAVLNVVPQQEQEVDLDRELTFTPHYDKPLKVNRTPRRRSEEYYIEEVPEFIVEPTNNSNVIQTALAEEPIVPEPVLHTPTRIEPEVPARDIKIDINNPESLPVPKSLNSYVISDSGVLTSKEAFDSLAVNVHKEIMLEIPSLTDLSDRVLSHVPTIYSRVIINEFDVSDVSYMFLISSLLKQGVHIKTVPKVHAINLITDDSHAMIISEGKNDIEYGAIYDDRSSISNIRADFEKTWNIASNLDESILVANASGGVA